MKILVLYRKFKFFDRRTITDHLYSFKRYYPEGDFLYLDVSSPSILTPAILSCPYDVVLLHYTFLVQRMDGARFDTYYRQVGPKLRQLRGVKVLIPHDEYSDTAKLWQIARDCEAKYIFCSCYPEDYHTLYPKSEIGEHCVLHTVLTGYVEPTLVQKYAPKLDRKRSLDIGYRALDSGYLFGRHGLLKVQIVREFERALARHPTIRSDIALTGYNKRTTKYGGKWFDFLLSCRTALGCLGGSSIIDADGSIKKRLSVYMKAHPNASYEDVLQHCYQGQDDTLSCFLLGPRNFEYAITKTCQVLVEGDYRGVLFPGTHYIEIKKDFSNIDAVIEMTQNEEYCAQLAANCYTDLVLSGKYSYEAFAQTVIKLATQSIDGLAPSQKQQKAWRRIKRNPYYKVHAFGSLLKYTFVGFCGRVLAWISEPLYQKVRSRLGIG